MRNYRTKNLKGSCALATIAALFAGSFFYSPAAQGQAQSTRRLVTQEVDESRRVTMHGNVHPFARTEFDRGAMNDSQPINRIYLLLSRSAEQQTALEKLMLEQMDSSSANFHKWLTPEEYGAKFGPSDADIQAVKDWLSVHGFTGIKTNNGKTIVEFSGTVGTVRSAFSTEIHKFSMKGEEHFANASDPQIPAALAPVVMGITSLHNFRKEAHVKRFGKFRRDLLSGETRPLFTFTDVNGTFFGMGPADFAKIYNVPNGLAGTSGFDGTGQTIAVVGRSNINIQDVRDFRTMFGLPAKDPVIILNGADPGLVSGDEGEADLDVEWSGAVAPGATIKLVVSESEQTDGVDGVDASAEFIVDNNIAPVMSESFGSCEAANGTAENAFLNALWQQAAAEGITVSVSSGDNGAAGCDNPNSASSATHGIAVSGTASTPFNVAVGGTDFDDSGTQNTFWNSTNTNTTAASAKGYIPEIPWNDSCGAAGLTGCNTATSNTNLNIVAGSGGPSAIYTKTQAPFQTGFGDAQRDIPDVSFFAADGLNRSFYIVCQSDQDIAGDTGCNLTKFVTTAPFHDFQAVGGTSASAPAFAGVMALVNQKTGQRQGNANFVLYSLAKNETFANCNSSSFTNPGTALPGTCVFLDVTKSNIAVACVGASPNCSKTSSGGNGVLASGGNPAFNALLGYDLATGLGSINVNALLNNWSVPATKASTTAITSPASITTTLGTQQTISGTVTGTPGTPSGVVVIENSLTGAPIDTATLSGNTSPVTYTVTTTLLPAGTYSIRAHYGGDGAFGPSDSATTVPVSIGKQNAKVIVSFVTATGQITTAAQSVAYGSPYILRVDVANNAGTTCENIAAGTISFICPTGTVTLLDNNVALKDFPNAQTPGATNIATLNDRGFIEDQPIQLNVGTHPITANYTADANSSYISSTTTNTLSVTITQAATTTAVAGSPSTITSGASVTLTATVSSNSNSAQGPTGTIQFQNGGVNIGSPVTCTPKGATSSAGASCTATLSTTLSALPPFNFDGPMRRTPFEWLAALLSAIAILLWLMTMRARDKRSAYGYAAIAFFFAATAILAGCSGSGGGGGGGGSHTDSITAKYSGDTNYATSQGTGSVTVQ
ncbi:MAG TPA: protease pro-enzyme activation domain-containing protein [Candidatus Acidoferrum sp.]|nr:protease pro-enzyme activation domain-containing protein [Candidatus Acidoferrum sp.]